MGAEATCTAEFRGKKTTGKARLETDVLQFRGADLRLTIDVIFYGASHEAELVEIKALRKLLRPAGALWIIRPKGRPEISGRSVMSAGKAAGLVDVKVVSFSATHTAEKFVIPLAKRKRQ